MRLDGRAGDQLRSVKITRSFNKYAEGSCLIEMGDTKVICTASIEDKVPPFLKNTGQGWVTAEYGMLPRSCETRTTRDIAKGQINGRSQEIQRLVGRSIRSVADMGAFGERTVWLDCDVIQADGGTRTASITGAFIAYLDACALMKKDGIVKKLPYTDLIAAISVGVVMSEELLDLNYKEDSNASVDMNVVMTASGRIIEVQSTAEGAPFTRNRFNNLLDLATKGTTELTKLIKEKMADIL
ncbi:MAG: ribonuclease PH [Armatimonadetes bacterium]|nr:ribonuclease PH [Armatimonadota bacterium]